MRGSRRTSRPTQSWQTPSVTYANWLWSQYESQTSSTQTSASFVQTASQSSNEMNQSSIDFGLARGHSPLAHKVVCVDFDGTLFPWGPIYADMEPMPGAVEAVRRLKDAGFRVVIFTSRLSQTWLTSEYGWLWRDAYSDQYRFITAQCKKYGIPFDGITAEKIPAVAYIDDKAKEYCGNDSDWPFVVDDVISQYGDSTPDEDGGHLVHRADGSAEAGVAASGLGGDEQSSKRRDDHSG